MTTSALRRQVGHVGARLPVHGLVLIAIAAVIVVTVGFSNPYNQQLLFLVVTSAIGALSLYIVIGLTGQFALATNALIGVGAYTSALSVMRLGVPYLLAIVMAAFMSGLLGAALGVVALRVKGHYLALVTVAFSIIVVQVLTNWRSLTRGSGALVGVPMPDLQIGGLDLQTPKGITILAIVLLLAFLWFTTVLQRRNLGIAAAVLREDEDLAESLGINTFRVKVVVFTISSVWLGGLGAIQAAYLGILAPDMFGISGTIRNLMMLIIGGFTLGGVVIGAAFVTLLPEMLRVAGNLSQLIVGAVVLVVILIAPGGVAGSIRARTYELWRRASPTLLRAANRGGERR